MKTKILSVVVLLLSLNVSAQYNLSNLSVGGLEFDESGNYKDNGETSLPGGGRDVLQHKKLRLYMVRANDEFLKLHRDLGNYLTVKEAYSKNVLSITETSSGGTVNTLYAQNTGKDTIMLLAGDVITGGKQDRVIGQDVLLAPNQGKISISVFCVGPGRWTPKTSGTTFNQYFGFTSANVRKSAIANKEQGKVWEEVGKINDKAGTKTSTGTYTAVMSNDDIQKELLDYKDHLEALMLNDSAYVGMMAVSGNEVLSFDVFGTHTLFRKSAPGLLQSAAMEAITGGSAVDISEKDVADVVSDILADEKSQEEKLKATGQNLTVKGKKAHLNYNKVK